MGWRVALTDAADADLGNVAAFLAQKSPAAAERLGLELVDLIFSLDQLPHRGAAVRKRPGLRMLAHRHYLVIYRLNEATAVVEIVRVWDHRPDPARLRLPWPRSAARRRRRHAGRAPRTTGFPRLRFALATAPTERRTLPPP